MLLIIFPAANRSFENRLHDIGIGWRTDDFISRMFVKAKNASVPGNLQKSQGPAHDRFEISNHVFIAHFEPWIAQFGRDTFPEAHERNELDSRLLQGEI